MEEGKSYLVGVVGKLESAPFRPVEVTVLNLTQAQSEQLDIFLAKGRDAYRAAATTSDVRILSPEEVASKPDIFDRYFPNSSRR